jgi:hypothetical protein
MKGSKAPPIDVDALVAQLGGEAPLAPAAAASARELVRSWFQWKAPGASAAARRTLLHVAAHYGSPGAVRALLELGADPNGAGDDGATPMHCACHARADGLAEVLELLLARGADRELRDSLGRRPVDLLLAQVRPTPRAAGKVAGAGGSGRPAAAVRACGGPDFCRSHRARRRRTRAPAPADALRRPGQARVPHRRVPHVWLQGAAGGGGGGRQGVARRRARPRAAAACAAAAAPPAAEGPAPDGAPHP